jgi:Zn-dependent peptidase ImmA (M78 family)/DNA-binding XRE family transcriptional regulator
MFSASRMALARKRRGLPLSELTAQAGVGVQSLSNYENGRQKPSSRVIQNLAESLEFPVAFFSAPDIDLLQANNVSFRARSKLPARKRDVALSVGRLAIEFHDWVSGRFNLPELDLPSLNKPDPETAADMVRARWELGTTPVLNMVHLLEARGIRVFSIAPEYSQVDAFSVFHDGIPFVFLNTMKTAERNRFDAAHELGHLVLHGQGCDLVKSAAEQEANDFASAFLMPRGSVIAHMPPSPLIDQILYGKRIWNVSALALTYRLHDIGMLSDWHYRTTCIELGQRGYRSGEPQSSPRETSQLLDKVFRLLRKRGVSRADIASQLHIMPDDINDYVFGLAMTAVDGNKEAPRSRGESIQRNLTTVSLQGRKSALCPWCHQRHDVD